MTGRDIDLLEVLEETFSHYTEQWIDTLFTSMLIAILLTILVVMVGHNMVEDEMALAIIAYALNFSALLLLFFGFYFVGFYLDAYKRMKKAASSKSRVLFLGISETEITPAYKNCDVVKALIHTRNCDPTFKETFELHIIRITDETKHRC